MLHITLKQLKLLDAIDRHASITKAAKEAHLSQPAVSLQMKQLEEMIGDALWEKINKRLYLTHTGKILLAAAHDMLSRLEDLEGELEASKGKVVGDLDIAVVTSAKHFLPYYLGEFVRAHPDVRPRLKVTNRASVIEAIHENRHDLYIMGQIPERLAVETFPILDNIIEVVAAPDHPLVGEKEIPLKRIAEERFLVREPGSGTRIAVEKLFARHRLEINPFMELGSTGAIKNAVIAGLGIATLSRHSLEFEMKSNSISVLQVEHFPLRRRWYAAYPSGKHLSVAASSFLSYLCEEAAKTKP